MKIKCILTTDINSFFQNKKIPLKTINEYNFW